MSKGRKRKAGKREPNGRLRRDSRMNTGEKPNAMAARETVALRRCRAMGWGHETADGSWIASTAQQVEAVNPVYGTMEGRLWKAGRITQRQYDAATAYAKLDARYRSAMGYPSLVASSADVMATRGAASDPFDIDERSIANIRAAHRNCTRALLDANAITATMAVVLCNVEPDDDMLDALRRGLDAIDKVAVTGC